MIGRTFGRWTVLAELKDRQHGKRMYLCRCACGNEGRCVAGNLRSGISRSCGCYGRERTHQAKFIHGRNTSDRTYRIWSGMRDRCRNPRSENFPRYGGRGISVCDRWGSFEHFLEDMGEAPEGMSIERSDNDGNYEPINCRWATDEEQRLNKRTTRYVTAFGQTKPLTVWVKERDMPFLLVWKRLARGWSPERSLTEQNKRVA